MVDTLVVSRRKLSSSFTLCCAFRGLTATQGH